jgi:hypothetical protein
MSLRYNKEIKDVLHCDRFQPFFQIIREFGKEIHSGLLFNFVNADGKYLQWLTGGMVWNDETYHFLRRSQVIDDFIKRLGSRKLKNPDQRSYSKQIHIIQAASDACGP